MSKKLINSICLIIIAMVMCINGVDAFTLIKGEAVQIKSDGVFHEIFKKSIESNGTLLYCLSGANVGIYDKDYSDKMIIDGTYTEEQRLVIGNIINSNSSGFDYYKKEVAIFTYLNIKDGKYDATSDSSYAVVNDEIKNAGTNASNYIFATATLNAQKLEFTLVGDNYVSQDITVTSDAVIDIVSGGNNLIIPTIETSNDNKSFKVKVPRNQVTEQMQITVEIQATSPSIIVYSPKVVETPPSEGYQDLAMLTNVEKKLTSISGTITPKGKITINKYDNNNIPLSGAKIVIKGKNTRRSETFITDGNPIVLDGWDFDTYVIEEESAPEGYAKAPNQEVTISETNPEQTVNLIDNILKISILKVDESGKVLPGATLKLTDKDGKTLKICGQMGNGECRWKTTESEYVIEKIPVGTYYIKEVSAPDTYDVSNDSIKLIITSDGLVTIKGKDIKGETIKFENKKTRTEISKVSAVDGKELPGATIQIMNYKNEEMSCVILNDKGKEEILEKCTWVSGDKPVTIIGLSKGKYFIKEIITPEGYVLNETLVGFEVKANGKVTKAVMKNDLEVKVPDTLSARSTLLLAISMFDIALGIGILTYVKKYKTEE